MKTLLTKIKNLIREEEGASAVEYGLLVALIAVALIASMKTLTTAIQGAFTKAGTALDAAGS